MENPEPSGASAPGGSKAAQKPVGKIDPFGASNFVVVKNLTDEQFESTMQEFSRRLEQKCHEAVKHHAKKLRPNYDETWVLSLQTQL